MDVQDPGNPQYVTSFTNGLSAIDHNPMVRGNFIFEANYRSGLRIFDISDVMNVREVGYYDTFPSNDAPQFNGAWGVDTSLPSGNVVVSDTDRGLFVFDVSEAMGVPPGSYEVNLQPNEVITDLDFGNRELSPHATIDFTTFTIDPYGGPGQDDVGPVTIEDGGATLHIEGNRWKKIDFAYNVGPDTILEFNFKSSKQGEAHAIGFDTDTSISPERSFHLYGTQNWGAITDVGPYSPPAFQHFQIPVGQYFTGPMNHLFFANDHDVPNPDANSFFSNVSVYEANQPANPPPTANGDPFEVTEDSGTTNFDVLFNDSTAPDVGETLTIIGATNGSAGGTVTIVSGTNIDYAPVDDFFGIETFTYTINDGTAGNNATATVTVTVTPTNDLPTADDDTFSVGQNSGTTTDASKMFTAVQCSQPAPAQIVNA